MLLKTDEIPSGARLGLQPVAGAACACSGEAGAASNANGAAGREGGGPAQRPPTLADLRPGDRARVIRVGGEPSMRRRLLELGFVSGTLVRVVRFAPLGDPMQVELHGYHISLRHAEARAILVDPVR